MVINSEEKNYFFFDIFNEILHARIQFPGNNIDSNTNTNNNTSKLFTEKLDNILQQPIILNDGNKYLSGVTTNWLIIPIPVYVH